METTYASQVIDEQTAKRAAVFWRELPILLGVAILVAFMVRAFVLQTFYIPSESMEHTLNINDRVLVNKLVYDFRDPHRGEIVVFKAPEEWRSDPDEEDFIKRVIGVGGDHVVCCDDRAGSRSTASRWTSHTSTATRSATPRRDEEFDIVVPDGGSG